MMDYKQYLTFYRDIVDKNVAGYFYPIDIVLMHVILKYCQQNIKGDICEIGIAEGKSAISFSNFKEQNDNLYLYDIFSEDNVKKVEKNLQTYGINVNIDIRLQDTTKLKTEDIKFENKLRVLHIDGCHEYEAVMSDLRVFGPLVHDDGIIMLDDYNDYEFPGVNAAAIEFCLSKDNHRNWRVFAIGDNKAYMCLKDKQEFYQTKIIEYISDKFNKVPNRPFEIKMGLRQLLDINALLCDSRENWIKEKLLSKMFSRPEIK
jgi:cephalosporin hydroxylase